MSIISPVSAIEEGLLSNSTPREIPFITMGVVVNTNDPQQMGRIQVICERWGDALEMPIADVLWCVAVPPFAGTLTKGLRGPENIETKGPVSYGMWAIPKVGSRVLVCCIDGDPDTRAWLGSVHVPSLAQTMPHGRFLEGGEEGPVSSTQEPIEPLMSNALTAFDLEKPDDPKPHEWQTRIADNQVSANDKGLMKTFAIKCAKPDDKTKVRRGYQETRINPDITFKNTENKNLDPQTYSITTPGFHSISMDDSLGNGRIRIRTTSGNQIIMDDTNERLYISTPDGRNYIEMDRKGNIDIFSTGQISFAADRDINFTTKRAFRVSAQQIHMRSKNDTRIHADSNLMLRVEGNTHFNTYGNCNISSIGDMHLNTYADLLAHSECEMHLRSEDTMYVTSITYKIFLKAGSDIIQTGENIHLNGPVALEATEADIADADFAYSTSRVPIHEPWGRISNDPEQTDNDRSINLLDDILDMKKDSEILELKYEDDKVNKVDLGLDLKRNDNWRR